MSTDRVQAILGQPTRHSGSPELDPVSGTVAGLRSAFHTEIHRYAVGGRVMLANNAEPSIPRALARVVRGISGLNNIHPHSNLVLSGSKGVPAPPLTIYGGKALGAGNYDVNFAPVAGDAAVIYDAPNPAMNPKYSGKAWTGQGRNRWYRGRLKPERGRDHRYCALPGAFSRTAANRSYFPMQKVKIRPECSVYAGSIVLSYFWRLAGDSNHFPCVVNIVASGDNAESHPAALLNSSSHYEDAQRPDTG